jgi:hypothetical protein
MKLTPDLRRRGLVSRAIIVAAFYGAGATTTALAYDDKSTFASILELFGVKSDVDINKIDYHERSKIVVPPNRQGLPDPDAGGRASGLIDRDALRSGLGPSQAYASSDAGKKPDGGEDTPCSGEKRKDCWTVIPGQRWIAPASSGGGGPSRPATDSARKYLTEPPVAYVKPTKEAPATTDGQEKWSWMNPFSYFKQPAGKVTGGGQ